jgi:hypothetical protein
MLSSRSRKARRYHVAALVVAIAAGALVSAHAAGQSANQAPTAPQPAAPAAPGQPTALPACSDAQPKSLPPGNLKLTVTVNPTTLWQPRGGEVKFTIKGTGFTPDNMAIIACFRWKRADAAGWHQSPALRLIDNGTAVGAFTFSAIVPPDLEGAQSWWLQRVFENIFGGTKSEASTGLDLVPIADFRVMARSVGATSATTASAWSPLDITLPVGITSTFFSFIITIVLVLIAWTALYQFGKRRGVPGDDVILKIISTKGGYASLSQLQIILWSFVVGGGAVYVMSLSGNLITISQGTLVLLGISGTAAVTSKLQSYAETQSAPSAARALAPSVVVGLAVASSTNATEALLSWSTPIGGGSVEAYTVRYRVAVAVGAPPNAWTLATSTLTRPGFRVVGLTADTPYEFEVFAVNAVGPGTSSVVPGRTATAPDPPPVTITDLHLTEVVTNSTIGVAWSAVQNANGYKVQYRIHDSKDDWTDSGAEATKATITKLRPNTLYDIRVAAFSQEPAGSPSRLGRWSMIQVATTGPRIPQWSDLVVTSDGVNEIDVTRVQMLFFTVIVALFVVLRILAGGEIPTIPDEYLVLMGISNGVYLTAKFIPS